MTNLIERSQDCGSIWGSQNILTMRNDEQVDSATDSVGLVQKIWLIASICFIALKIYYCVNSAKTISSRKVFVLKDDNNEQQLESENQVKMLTQIEGSLGSDPEPVILIDLRTPRQSPPQSPVQSPLQSPRDSLSQSSFESKLRPKVPRLDLSKLMKRSENSGKNVLRHITIPNSGSPGNTVPTKTANTKVVLTSASKSIATSASNSNSTSTSTATSISKSTVTSTSSANPIVTLAAANTVTTKRYIPNHFKNNSLSKQLIIKNLQRRYKTIAGVLYRSEKVWPNHFGDPIKWLNDYLQSVKDLTSKLNPPNARTRVVLSKVNRMIQQVNYPASFPAAHEFKCDGHNHQIDRVLLYSNLPWKQLHLFSQDLYQISFKK